MLISLTIKNIALIEECKIELGKGLNVLSGETGAGKSIVIDSLSFILGGRADKSLIRYGAQCATVEGVFEVDNSFFPILTELGLEEENTVIIRRSMTDTRNDIRVNGQVFNLSMLKRLSSSLVDILGQHEHQSLLKVSNHIHLLDRYDVKIAHYLENYRKSYASYKDLKQQLESFGDERYRARRKETLAFQIEDIQKTSPKEGEEEELLKMREKFRNAEKLIEGVSGAYNSLESEELGVGAMIAQALGFLRSVTSYDDQLAELSQRLESAKIEIEDIAETLSGYSDSFDFDERTADKVERRVDAIRLLKKKYGSSISDILAELAKMQQEYDELEAADDKIERIDKKLTAVKEELFDNAVALSQHRRATAKKFEQAIIKQLNELSMTGTQFSVSFSDLPTKLAFEDSLGENGVDEVEFLISPNIGEPLRQLSKIASGGEMSRFMLALKNIIADLDNINTLVFDEIDTGISGHVAQTVAEKLDNISRTKQVIAVTHLPQLASFADNHYLISKSVTAGKTLTAVKLLKGEDCVSEVARLAGAETEQGKAHANQMILFAQQKKRTTHN